MTAAHKIKTAYRQKAKEHHPDTGGDHHRMAEVSRAFQEAYTKVISEL